MEKTSGMYLIEERGGEQIVRLPREYWYRRDEVSLNFPREWDVRVSAMKGDKFSVLTTDEICQRIQEPLGSPSIRDMAAGKKEVAIVVDDLTRPTRADIIARFVIDELLDAGVPKDGIRFLMSLGCHGAHGQGAFRKKLGDYVVENYPVYNHNCDEYCIYAGKTRRGIPLKINVEFMKCDLKIGIGTILPHLYAGYSGGGKIVLPGLSHIDTIDRFHYSLLPDQMGKEGNSNPLCGDIEDAVRLTGLDFKIDGLVNTRGEYIALYAGHPNEVYQKGIEAAREAYQSTLHKDQDVVISNAYLKVNEGDIAMLLGFSALMRSGGTCVLILQSPGGQMTHYLMRSFGKFIGGRQWVTRSRLPKETTLIVLSEYKDMTSFDSFAAQEKIIWMRRWRDVLEYLKPRYSGRPKVSIIPDGTVQYT